MEPWRSGAKTYGEELATALGFKNGRTPSVVTLFTVSSQVDKNALHRELFAWNEQVLASLTPNLNELKATGINGKALHGSAKQGALAPHILSDVRHGLGLMQGQEAVSVKENAIPVVTAVKGNLCARKRLLHGLVVKSEVFTMDALLTQKDIARQIVLKWALHHDRKRQLSPYFEAHYDYVQGSLSLRSRYWA